MRSSLRACALALLGLVAVDAQPADAQLWKPTKKPAATTTTAPARTTRPKPARAKKPKRAARPARPVARRPVERDEPERVRATERDRGDGLPEFDDAPEIVVERPGRGER